MRRTILNQFLYIIKKVIEIKLNPRITIYYSKAKGSYTTFLLVHQYFKYKGTIIRR